MKKNVKLSPEAILFDMDGVLVDSLDSWWKSLNYTLKNNKEEQISKKEFIDEFWGLELQENLKKLGLDKKISTFCNNIYPEFTDEIKIFNGTKETLEKLHNFRKAIITNTPEDCALKILKKYQIKKYFDVIITSDKIEDGKPAPDMIIKACEKLSLNPTDVILIGDTKSDVKAGNSAGCKVIGIDIKADYTVKKISDILNLFEK
jgi:HAD superfamily hydrolase (TIGR01549 family)